MGEYLAHLRDVVLLEMLIERVTNLQSVKKSEGYNFLLAVGDSGELMLEEIDLGLETFSLLHPDGEKVVATLLDL